ncbi:MAG: hypothetical protein LBI56_02610 [Puniceicoccales bacterium]|nr:hypothetical protein [Puniceicoccales bacterium]
MPIKAEEPLWPFRDALGTAEVRKEGRPAALEFGLLWNLRAQPLALKSPGGK